MPQTEESTRASKALLSKTETVPRWLLDKFPIPDGGCIHHTQFRDTSLPLFQAKLHNSKIFEGQKQSCIFKFLWFRDLCEGLSNSMQTNRRTQQLRNSISASYNPNLDREQLNERITLVKTLPARQRSMAQAFFFTWTWLSRAVKPAEKKRKRSQA